MNTLRSLIDRPIRATVIGLVILLLGLQAVLQLTVREYPETTNSTIIVTTPYIGANAELVRGFITTPLEQAIASAEGIDYLQSTSMPGISTITARLELNYDPNEAVAEILTKIQQVRNQLPDESEDSVVTISTGQDRAAMYLAFYSNEISTSRITDYLNRAVRPRLETVAGVQRAQVFGGQSIAMRVWLDPDRMAALHVTPGEVRQAITRSNFLAAVGATKGAMISISLRADTNLETVESFRELVIREEDETIVRLQDIAEISLGAESYDSSVLFGGNPVVFIGIEIAPEANVLDTVQEVRALVPDVHRQLPAGLDGVVVYDSTEAIQDSIDEVIWALIEALAIVTLVIFLFLGSIRSALVPAIAMPLAIVGAFFAMQVLGYSINLLTLLALILAIGTVVDDGIVLVENASRHIEGGATVREAAKRTLDELAGSIVAMNIVVLAVFAPMGLMGGLTGSLFTEFAYTVAAATLFSGVIALTVAPMMCSRLLKSNTHESWLAQRLDAGFQYLARAYSAILSFALDLRWLVLVAGGVALVGVYLFYSVARRELAPAEDIGFLAISSQAAPNSSIDQLERWTNLMADKLSDFDSVQRVFAVNGGNPQGGGGSNSAFGGIILTDWQNRPSQAALQGQFQQTVSQIAGLQSVVISPPSLPGAGGGTPVQFVISAVDQPRVVFEATERILRAARESGLFIYIDSDLKFDRPQFEVVIDRDRAATLGIDISQFGGDLATMLSGGNVNYFSYDGRSYRVIPQVERPNRLRPAQLLDYRIATRTDELVPVSAFATLEQSVEPQALHRFNQLNSATLSGVPTPGVSLGEAIEFLRQEADKALPQDYITDWTGRSRQYVSESASMLLAFALAVVLMYLTLAFQYESFRNPAVMLISVPMSLAGALLFFALGVVSLNIYTQIGLLALISSIIRHGILLVEFARDIQRDEAVDRRQAIEKAASLRFRSILMTTTATLVGLIPLLLATGGPGAASRFAISFTLGVGMALGTLFTLFVVPALYTVLASRTVSAEPFK